MYKTKRTPFLKENFGTKIITNQLTLYVNNICNTNCEYCAIDKQQSLNNNHESNKEMSLDDFKSIFYMKGIENINDILYQGKEPTLWKHLGESIKITKKNGKKAIVFTNGINKVDINPNILILHIDEYYNTDIKYWKTLSKRNNFKLFTVIVIGVKSNIDYYYDIITKYSDEYILIPESPIKFNIRDKIMIKKLLFLFKKLYLSGFRKYIFEHPIPYCLIDNNDIDFLEKNNIIFGGTCQAPKSIIIDYDLKKTFPCIMLPDMSDFNILDDNLIKQFNKHLDYSDNLRKKMPKKECYNCKYYINKYCQGGCLINRY